LTRREYRRKVGVGGDKHAVFLRGACKDNFIVGLVNAVTPHLNRVMPGEPQLLCDKRRQGTVDEEIH
jgi:hypothetical protein